MNSGRLVCLKEKHIEEAYNSEKKRFDPDIVETYREIDLKKKMRRDG